MDEELLRHYRTLVEFLGKVLGSQYEVVLHVVTSEEEAYIGAIANGEVSGRSLNSSLTDLARNMIKDKKYKDCDYLFNYVGKMANGKEFSSSTYFIKDSKGELLGLLCFNFDTTKHKLVAQEILQLANIRLPISKMVSDTQNDEYVEHFPGSIQDIIYDVVDFDLFQSDLQLTKDKKINIIKELNDRNVFQMKGAVQEVSSVLKISEASIYRYLQLIQRS
ncbi:helix-turn-helix transcriptional regulator [Neobacillus niacini]|jgi:predicted transcriptional regulator YheO|uniref:helix-turn-helix transcriptional regulator n=1 Tax=Neobacillus niacini TaxID=86668 RepID=UPI00203CA964|nr:PAS domain-containing protein [Neobacillus niacini]MCM3690084.1 PAS domain-containing protein [Neobacillus niacini]